jgi:hypothetical protein
MDLSEYREEVEKLERGELTGTDEALAVRAGLLAHQLETALWQPWAKAEARELAVRARLVQETRWAAHDAMAWGGAEERTADDDTPGQPASHLRCGPDRRDVTRPARGD